MLLSAQSVTENLPNHENTTSFSKQKLGLLRVRKCQLILEVKPVKPSTLILKMSLTHPALKFPLVLPRSVKPFVMKSLPKISSTAPVSLNSGISNTLFTHPKWTNGTNTGKRKEWAGIKNISPKKTTFASANTPKTNSCSTPKKLLISNITLHGGGPKWKVSTGEATMILPNTPSLVAKI